MKISYLILSIFLILISCSSDDVDYSNITGKVERIVNGEGIANQLVVVKTRKRDGTGLFSSIIELDEAEVVTDENGKFSVSLINDVDAYVTILHLGDDIYSGSSAYEDFPINEPIIIKRDKFIKFKVSVKNTTPFDENDFIKIDFYVGLAGAITTKIENFGVDNTYHPEEQLPGGGSIGPWEETSWTGMDVNSIVYYSVYETSDKFLIQWSMKKNGIESSGFTNEIPYDINEINPFLFEY